MLATVRKSRTKRVLQLLQGSTEDHQGAVVSTWAEDHKCGFCGHSVRDRLQSVL